MSRANLIYFDRAVLSHQDGSFSVEINNVRAQWDSVEWDEPLLTSEQVRSLGTLLKLVGMVSKVINVLSLDQVSNCQLTYNRVLLTHANKAIAVMEPGENRPYDLLLL